MSIMVGMELLNGCPLQEKAENYACNKLPSYPGAFKPGISQAKQEESKDEHLEGQEIVARQGHGL